MNIPKAIEILRAILQTGQYDGDPDDSDALELGLEALKRLKELRHIEAHFSLKKLPGEAK